jgi:hypothetical protein
LEYGSITWSTGVSSGVPEYWDLEVSIPPWFLHFRPVFRQFVIRNI